MNKEEVIKKLISPLRTDLSKDTLKRRFSSAIHGTRSQFLIKSYGCERCAIKDNCESYPHANGMCMRRGKMYVEYFKAGKSDLVPLMIDQLAKVSTEMDIEHEKGIKFGKMTVLAIYTWF